MLNPDALLHPQQRLFVMKKNSAAKLAPRRTRGGGSRPYGVSPDNPNYRKGVGVVVVNEFGKILVCERTDVAGAWQLPQGGIDPNEQPRDTLFRELEEETGLLPHDVKIITEHSQWLSYDWPGKKRHYGEDMLGQVQKWFLLEFIGNPDAIDVTAAESAEFARHKWVHPAWLIRRVIAFRRPIYKAVLREFYRPIQTLKRKK